MKPCSDDPTQTTNILQRTCISVTNKKIIANLREEEKELLCSARHNTPVPMALICALSICVYMCALHNFIACPDADDNNACIRLTYVKKHQHLAPAETNR